MKNVTLAGRLGGEWIVSKGWCTSFPVTKRAGTHTHTHTHTHIHTHNTHTHTHTHTHTQHTYTQIPSFIMSTRKYFLDQIKIFSNCVYNYRQLKLKARTAEAPKNFTQAVPVFLLLLLFFFYPSRAFFFLQCKRTLTD